MRLEMGRPDIRIVDAAEREIMLPAMTLYQKSERLCVDHTRERQKLPKFSGAEHDVVVLLQQLGKQHFTVAHLRPNTEPRLAEHQHRMPWHANCAAA